MQISFQKRKIFIIAIGVLLIISLFFTQQKIRNFFYFVSSPIQKSFWKLGNKISTPIELIFEMKELKKKAEELSFSNQNLLSEIIQLQILKKENERLREALELDIKKDFQLALAEVIGKNISKDTLVINKGLMDGILEGMPVINEGRVLIGKITDVSENFSNVILISNRESSFDVEIQAIEVNGLVKGKGDFQLFLDLIPENQEIQEGDLITTTAIGGIFPKGILVGKIQKILSNDMKPFQQAEVSPLFDITKLEIVFIITNYK